VQPFFESTHYDLIDSHDLSILLWIRRGGIPILNAQVTTVPPESFAFKLKSFTFKLKTIVRDEGVRNPKLSDNIFPHESLSIHVLDIC